MMKVLKVLQNNSLIIILKIIKESNRIYQINNNTKTPMMQIHLTFLYNDQPLKGIKQ